MCWKSRDREVEETGGGERGASRMDTPPGPSPARCTCLVLLPWIDLLLSLCLPQSAVIDKTNIFFAQSDSGASFRSQQPGSVSNTFPNFISSFSIWRRRSEFSAILKAFVTEC